MNKPKITALLCLVAAATVTFSSCGKQVPQEEYDALLAEKETLSAEKASIQEELSSTTTVLNETKEELESTAKELKEAEADLDKVQKEYNEYKEKCSLMKVCQRLRLKKKDSAQSRKHNG